MLVLTAASHYGVTLKRIDFCGLYTHFFKIDVFVFFV